MLTSKCNRRRNWIYFPVSETEEQQTSSHIKSFESSPLLVHQYYFTAHYEDGKISQSDRTTPVPIDSQHVHKHVHISKQNTHVHTNIPMYGDRSLLLYLLRTLLLWWDLQCAVDSNGGLPRSVDRLAISGLLRPNDMVLADREGKLLVMISSYWRNGFPVPKKTVRGVEGDSPWLMRYIMSEILRADDLYEDVSELNRPPTPPKKPPFVNINTRQ